MLKYVLMAGAALAATPVLAQDAPTAPQTAPQSQTPPAAQPPVAEDQMAAKPDATAPSDTAAQPAATQDQIAQVVETQFPSYDKDGNGTLSSGEFGAWMVALRSQNGDGAKTEGPEMKKWTATAFAQADNDKSKSVTKTELMSFLASNKG